jgi:hypothetical protein
MALTKKRYTISPCDFVFSCSLSCNLKKIQISPRGQQQPVVSRDQQRDYFLAFQPSESIPFSKPTDVFAEGGHLHNPNPGTPLPAETVWPGMQSAPAASMASATESSREDGLFFGVKSNKKRRGPNQLPEQVSETSEAQAYTQVSYVLDTFGTNGALIIITASALSNVYIASKVKIDPHGTFLGMQLLELERRIDAAFSRRVLDAEEDLRCPPTRPCRVQLCLFNNYSAQPGTLHGLSRNGKSASTHCCVDSVSVIP